MHRASDRPTGPLDSAPEPRGADQTLAPGSMLGSRYKILSVLGYGGMGVVYRALDLKLDLEIALKRLRPDRVTQEKREVLRREIILSRKVTHENVCRIYDLEEIDGVEYVSMEHIRGTSLKDIEEKEGVLPLGRGLSIAKGICRGLAAAHRIGVLHRDLKPENVMVDEEGCARLMDFGIAVDKSQVRQEKSNTVPGTPQFLAPELLRGAAPDARSDLYAVGILLFEMFTGRVPFDDADTLVLVRKVLTQEAPGISTLRPDLPREFADILERAIAKDPAARFPSADALAAAIESYEGAFLDRVLKEVSVVRAKSVKLMVMLEANKALAATFEPTEILQIILKTATEETDAERGTIFLVEPGTRELVSQILEGGAVNPIRVQWGQGIAGACAADRQPILTVNVASDPRHDRRPDATSGFKTMSILAAPMVTPSGEVVGVIEVLNKRKRYFTKEDEEFLVVVAEHAALAVSSARQHQDAVNAASRQAEEKVIRSLRSILAPRQWPSIPGFESEPLRWRSETPHLLAFDAVAGPAGTAIVLVEDGRDVADGIGDLVTSISDARSAAGSAPLRELVGSIGRRLGSVSIARISPARAELACSGAPLPFIFRGGRILPFPAEEIGSVTHGSIALEPEDILLILSRGVGELAGSPPQPLEKEAHRAAQLAGRSESMSAGLTELISLWKGENRHPGARDALVIGARWRQPEKGSLVQKEGGHA
jgi:putative methionine-R-sulfoxide reductase with GAF domain